MWKKQKNGKGCRYPTYTLNALALLKEPQFRMDILSPDNAKVIMDEMHARLFVSTEEMVRAQEAEAVDGVRAAE